MMIESAQEVREFRKDARAQTERVRRAMARKLGVGASYYHGHHFQSRDESVQRDWQAWQSSLRQAGVNTDDMRVAMNRVTRHIIKIAAASFMHKFDPQVRPGPRSRSAQDARVAQVNEDVLFHMARASGFIEASRVAALRRSIAGQWLVGLGLNVRYRDVERNGKAGRIEEKIMRAFEAPMHRLSLDPGNESRDLQQHDWAIYTDVWTKRKLQRVLGLEIADDDLAEIGTLTPIEQEYATLTNGSLFRQYREHSKTKGALVHAVYVKDTDARFAQCWIEIELKGRDSVVWNEEDPTNPFGGSGLPFIRLGGHKAAEGWVDQSDFDLLKDDQDLLNLAITQEQRLMRKSSGRQWDVDARWFDKDADEESIRDQFTNEVYGVRVGRPHRDAKPPILQDTGSPANWFGNVVARQEQAVQDQSFRPASFQGDTKSHVPAEVVIRTMEAAGDVFGQRVIEDIEQYESMARVMLGTTIGLVQAGNIHTLQYLRTKANFGESEFSALSAKVQNMECPSGTIMVRDSSARYQSVRAIEQAMALALQMGAMSPAEWRAARARDLDLPLGDNERGARIFAQDMVERVLAGEPYQPLPMRPTMMEIVVAEFEQSMLDSRLSPEQRASLAAAIEAQTQLMLRQQMQAAMAADPQSMAPAEPEPTAADAADPMALLGAALQGQT